MTPDGTIKDFLSTQEVSYNYMHREMSAGALYGYNVDSEGYIAIPGMGQIKVSGLTLEETRNKIQELAIKFI